MRGPLFAVLLCAGPAFGCVGAGQAEPRAEGPTLPLAPRVALAPDWRTSPPERFEAWVLATFREDSATPIETSDMRALQKALDAVEDLSAVRAAVVLGRSRYSSCAALLIRRLEKRVSGPARHSDAGDCLAAAALARFPDPRRYAQRLVPLSVGSNPHPDLEVRVECAATALFAGYPEVIPFLLQVLRVDTYDGQSDARDFTVSPTTAWARGRAAEALSLYAGLPLAYRFDGSIAHREAEARRLAQRLQDVRAATGEDPHR